LGIIEGICFELLCLKTDPSARPHPFNSLKPAFHEVNGGGLLRFSNPDSSEVNMMELR
jgi:hypothetical protein